MKFYLASRFSRKDEIEHYARLLREDGHEVTSRWHTPGHQLGPAANEIEFRLRGTEDLEDVRRADAVIVHTGDVDPATGASTRGGYHTEVGIALGLGKPIALVGEKLNVFHYIPGVVRYDFFQDVWRAIEEGNWPPMADSKYYNSDVVARLDYPVLDAA
jgi:nucleoside 2-deoxyribosyltransferase